MKTLFILKKDPDSTTKTIISGASRESEVTVINLQENKDYDSLVKLIEQSDRIITL